MISVALFLLLTSTITVNAACNTAGCVDELDDGKDINMTACFVNYFQAWGMPYSFPPPFDVYVAWADEYLFADVNNIDNACTYYSNFLTCMGGSNNSFTTSNFKNALKLDNDTAANIWVFALYDIDYSCGPGKTGYRQAVSCNYRSTNCTRSDGCDNTMQYFQCLNKEINNECGKDAVQYECYAENIELQIVYPQCTQRVNCTTFTDTTMKVCFRNLFNAFKIPMPPFPPAPADFNRLVDSYLLADINNIDGACAYYNDFLNCLGGNTSVYTNDNVKNALGVNDTIAAYWVFASYDMDYTCKNTTAFKKSFNCPFDISICGIPSDCDSAVKSLTCANDIINIQCGKDVAIYECQSETLAFQYEFACNKSVNCTNFAESPGLQTCFQTYFSDWGFKNGSFPPDLATFANKTETFIKQNASNLDIVCNRFFKFYNCSGNIDYVFDIDFFKNALGVHTDLANLWLFMFLDQQYTCGDGLKGAQQLISCNPDISSCSNATNCDSLLDRFNCVNNIISSQCGNDAAQYECQAQVLETKYIPRCTVIPDCNHLGDNSSTTLGLRLITMIFSFVMYLLN